MPDPRRIELKRDLGRWSAMSIVVGTIIGSGIFLVPSSMIRHVGSFEMVLLVWIFGGLLSLAGAFSYAELAAAMPEAGGEYVYLRESYGKFWGFFYSWTMSWVGKSGALAAMATGFVYYLTNFIPALDTNVYTLALPVGPGGGPLEITLGQFAAMGLIVVVAVINYHGVKLGGRVQAVVTAAKVGLILGIVAVALLWGDNTQAAEAGGLVRSTGGVTGFFAALVAALWAFDGWNNAAMVASEVRDPRRNLPLALIGGVALTIAVYVLTNIAYFHVLSPAEIAASDRVAATMMERIFGGIGGAIVSAAAMISIFGAINGSLLSGARIPYAAARDGLFFRVAGVVHPKHRTPSASILLLSLLAAALVLTGRFEQLFTCVIFAEWLLYAMTGAAVLVLRRRRPEMERPFRTPGYPLVPVLFVLVATGLLVATMIQSPRESLIGIGLILAGLPFFWYWRRSTLL